MTRKVTRGFLNLAITGSSMSLIRKKNWSAEPNELLNSGYKEVLIHVQCLIIVGSFMQTLSKGIFWFVCLLNFRKNALVLNLDVIDQNDVNEGGSTEEGVHHNLTLPRFWRFHSQKSIEVSRGRIQRILPPPPVICTGYILAYSIWNRFSPVWMLLHQSFTWWIM